MSRDGKAHAELGASNAHRWIPCPGSVKLSRGMPNYENEHSVAGTAAHTLAERALKRRRDPEEWMGELIHVVGESGAEYDIEVTEEMVEAVREFTSYCTALMEKATLYGIESRITLAAFNPPDDMFGTSDFWSYDEGTFTLDVVDLKYGSGVVVEVPGNKQLGYYGLGAAVLPELQGKRIERVNITIVQPRAYHPGGVVRTVNIDYLELLAFAGVLLDAAHATQAPDAPLQAGPHCRFCPASPVCPEQRRAAQALAQVEFDAMPLDVPPAPETLPVAMLGDMLTKAPILEDWLKRMYAHAEELLRRGEEVPGFKLVERRKTRRWIDPDKVEGWLTEGGHLPEEIFKQELKSVAQIEKLVGKKNLPAEYVESKSSGYTMAPASDKRPAMVIHPGDDFLALPPGDVSETNGKTPEDA